MKKNKYLLTALILGCMNFGVSGQSYIDFTTEEMISQYSGVMPFAISPDGNYAAGGTFSLEGFIYDFGKATNLVFDSSITGSQFSGEFLLKDVNNAGVAVGYSNHGLVKCDASGDYEIIDGGSDGAVMVVVEKMNADASIIVGSVADESWIQEPCYWENGVRHILPMPTEEEMGFRVNGGTAKSISADGSVIMGYIIDRQQTNPMILWHREGNGSYTLDPVCLGKFEPESTVVYDDFGNIVEVMKGDNPYLQFKPAALSADGHSVAMYIVPNNDDLNPAMQVGIYNVKSGSLTVIENDPQGVIEQYGTGLFEIPGIANDCTMVGIAGAMALGAYPIIIDGADKVPMLLAEAYPQFPELQEFVVQANYGWPAFATAISPDGRFILGYGMKLEIGTAGLGFRIDRGSSDKIYLMTSESIVTKPVPGPNDPALYYNSTTGAYEGEVLLGKNPFKFYSNTDEGIREIGPEGTYAAISFALEDTYEDRCLWDSDGRWYVSSYPDRAKETMVKMVVNPEEGKVVFTASAPEREIPEILYLWGSENGGQNYKIVAELLPETAGTPVLSATYDVPECGPFSFDDPEFAPSPDLPDYGWYFFFTTSESVSSGDIYNAPLEERLFEVSEGADYNVSLLNRTGGAIICLTPGEMQFTVNAETLELTVGFFDPNAGVDTINDIKGHDIIYDLHGRRMDRRHLQPGIYIIYGKKVAVK